MVKDANVAPAAALDEKTVADPIGRDEKTAADPIDRVDTTDAAVFKHEEATGGSRRQSMARNIVDNPLKV